MAFIRLPGKSRRYIDTDTGATVSRRQYDKRFGALARGGFPSYEAKAKASSKRKRLSRPARGRSILGAPKSLRTIGPRVGKISREFAIKTEIDLDDPATYERYRNDFNDLVAMIKKNLKVFAVSYLAEVESPEGDKAKINVIPLYYIDSLRSFDQFIDALQERRSGDFVHKINSPIAASGFRYVNEIIFHLRYPESMYVEGKEKHNKPLRVKKREAVNAAKRAARAKLKKRLTKRERIRRK